jgi:8-oxo-dGTP pyrophosphatase MutT (NUDIX family)
VDAAVLLPLYGWPEDPGLVFTERRADLRRHAGEISFPGGRRDEEDPDLQATALREAEEEIGLDPATIEVFGELDHLATISSGSFIAPFVGVLSGRPETHPSPHEVEAVLHVALSELLDPGIFREEIWTFPGGRVQPITFFELVGDTVWGATASLLRLLLGMVTGTLGRGDLDHP